MHNSNCQLLKPYLGETQRLRFEISPEIELRFKREPMTDVVGRDFRDDVAGKEKCFGFIDSKREEI